MNARCSSGSDPASGEGRKFHGGIASSTLFAMMAGAEWSTFIAATPAISAFASVTAVTISTITAVAAFRSARSRAAREARSVAYAVSPSVLEIMGRCVAIKLQLNLLKKERSLEVGQAVAGAIGVISTISMPTMMDRYLDRLGALPEDVGRDCLNLISSVISFGDGTPPTVNEIGNCDQGCWLPVLENHLGVVGELQASAKRAADGLGRVIGITIR